MDYASLHLETTDTIGVEIAVEAILEPGWTAYLATDSRWTSLYFSSFDAFAPADLERFVVPLSVVYRVIVCVGDEEQNHLFEYRYGRVVDAFTGQIELRLGELEIPTALAFTDFEALEELEFDGELSDAFIKLERDPPKPGMGEYFGRSEDE